MAAALVLCAALCAADALTPAASITVAARPGRSAVSTSTVGAVAPADPTSGETDPTSVGADPTSVGADPTSGETDPTSVGAEPTSVGADRTPGGVEPTSVSVDSTAVGVIPPSAATRSQDADPGRRTGAPAEPGSSATPASSATPGATPAPSWSPSPWSSALVLPTTRPGRSPGPGATGLPGRSPGPGVSAETSPSTGPGPSVTAGPGRELQVAPLIGGEGKAKPIKAKEITKRLKRYLAGRPGPVVAMVKDLTTGREYRYHSHQSMITASTAKVQILAALLLKTPWRKLSRSTRHDADLMIRYSDNQAADRLWLKIGGASGFTRAGRKLGLKHTQGVPGNCVDLYCWGITRTTAADQIQLMRQLVSPKSPLRAKDRAQVLRLMGGVIKSQHWGVSAAACKGDQVPLKNGWLKRVSTKRWAIITVGLIRGHGHDYAVAVLTEGSGEAGYGIATVQGVATRVMSAFRTCKHS